jgi:hypothetical protein
LSITNTFSNIVNLQVESVPPISSDKYMPDECMSDGLNPTTKQVVTARCSLYPSCHGLMDGCLCADRGARSRARPPRLWTRFWRRADPPPTPQQTEAATDGCWWSTVRWFVWKKRKKTSLPYQVPYHTNRRGPRGQQGAVLVMDHDPNVSSQKVKALK